MNLGIASFVAAGVMTAGLSVAPGTVSVGVFDGGSGNYLVNPEGTDGLRQVTGFVVFRQRIDNGTIKVSGHLRGLAPRTRYVAVAYKDAICAPTPGVTAFPSGSFVTDRRGRVTIRNVTVNPAGFNPVGTFDVEETRSVSIRQALVQPISVPGIPAGTPTVPNGAAVEACDRSPFTN